MIRRIGRPRSSNRLFVEDCLRLEANPQLGEQVSLIADTDALIDLTASWNGQRWPLTLTLTASRQRLGGRRLWWRCPSCRRRCRFLLADGVDDTAAPFACRRCRRAVYLTDYPGRQTFRDFGRALCLMVHGCEAPNPTLAVLLDRRRRGRRRGRRVFARAVRMVVADTRSLERGMAALEERCRASAECDPRVTKGVLEDVGVTRKRGTCTYAERSEGGRSF